MENQQMVERATALCPVHLFLFSFAVFGLSSAS